MSPYQSLLEPNAQDALGASLDWLQGTMLGSLATALCILAFALLGLSMLAGQIPLRAAARSVLGSFILFGAPTIALALVAISRAI